MKLSTSLSEISNVGKLFDEAYPQKTSEDDGAVENTMTPSLSMPKPVVGVFDVTGC